MTNHHQDNEFLQSVIDEIKKCINSESDEYRGSKIKSTYLRLRDNNINKDKAINLIAYVITHESILFYENRGELFGERFFKNLELLPNKPSS